MGVINVTFVGIDDWHRPIFKSVSSNTYFGDTGRLWTFKEAGGEGYPDLIEHYKEDDSGLEYFGSSFGCEPNGGRNDDWEFNIVDG